MVQLDSDKSGRVLMQEYLQNELNHWLKTEVFNPQLEELGKEVDTVWLDFNPQKQEIEEEEQINEEENALQEEIDSDGDNINVKPTDGTNLNNIRNGENRLNEGKGA